MPECTKNANISKDRALNFHSAGLSQLNSLYDTLEKKERDFWCTSGLERGEIAGEIKRIEGAIDRAATKWACITAKSQRWRKFQYPEGCYYSVDTYQQMTTIQPKYQRSPGGTPPAREGEHIIRFTERSRQRLLSKARKLNTSFMRLNRNGKRKRVKRDLPIPYFVTLTYHKNFKDPETAKKHLNTFFQRWRRRGAEFAYFWKMEPQKRGAVHFHIAMFLPEAFNIRAAVAEQRVKGYIEKLKVSGKWKYHNYESVALMLLVGDEWAEITKEIDGVDVPVTRIKYIRKKRKNEKVKKAGNHWGYVNTVCRSPRFEYELQPDYQHKMYGTNVRKCDNWRTFVGYCGHYMKKEIRDNPWEGRATGRYWAFSYNLDFEALKTGFVSIEDHENLKDFAAVMNAKAFKYLLDYLIESAERYRKRYRGKRLKRKLKHLRNTFESQKRRFKINAEKIDQGYSLQFELPGAEALQVREYLQEDIFSFDMWHN